MKTGIYTFIMFVLGGVLLAPALTVSTEASSHTTQDKICENVPGQECGDASGGTVSQVTQTVTDVLTFLIGAISVIVIIIAGFMYVVSGGDPNKTKTAKNAILFAIVGLVVAISAQAIVRFVLNSI